MEKLINFRLFLFIAASLALGICSAYSFIAQKIGLGIVIIVSFILLLLIYLLFFTAKENRIKSVIFISIFATLFGLGVSVFYLQIGNYNAVNLGDHYYDIEGTIAEEHVTDYGAKYILKDVKVKGNVKGTLTYKVELYVYGEPTYQLGDVIAFSEYLFDKDLYYEGRFSSYSITDKVKYRVTIYDTDIKLVSSSPNLFEKTNLMIKENLAKGLSEKTFPVAYAMLTGNSDYMDLDVLTSYRRAGVAHIFAVSGLHIGFIAAILNFVFNKMRLNRVVKAVVVTLALLFYSGVCGFSASSLRATVMAAVLLFSAIKGEKYDGVSAVAVAAFLILLFNPAELFCVGFQLSFIVVFGILILGKPLSKIFKFLPRKMAESIGTVISAQLFGGLICLATFGTTSLISIIANLIFIPVVSVIFTAALIAVIISEIIGLHSILFFLIDLAFKTINFLITIFDYDVFIIGGFTFGGYLIFYYLTLIICSGFINLKRVVKAISCILFSLVFIVGTVFYNLDIKDNHYLIVSGSNSVSFTVIKAPDRNIMIVSYASKNFSRSRLKRIIANNGVNKIDELIITSGFDMDIPLFTANLRQIFKLGHVSYFGERDELMEEVFLKSFPDYYIDNFIDGEDIISTERMKVKFSLTGKLVDVILDEKNFGVFSSFNNGTPNYINIDKDYSLLVLLDSGAQIEDRLCPEKAVYYRTGGGRIDAERGGNLTFLLG